MKNIIVIFLLLITVKVFSQGYVPTFLNGKQVGYSNGTTVSTNGNISRNFDIKVDKN